MAEETGTEYFYQVFTEVIVIYAEIYWKRWPKGEELDEAAK